MQTVKPSMKKYILDIVVDNGRVLASEYDAGLFSYPSLIAEIEAEAMDCWAFTDEQIAECIEFAVGHAEHDYHLL